MSSRSYLLICQKCPARLERKYQLSNDEFPTSDALKSLRKELKNSPKGISIRPVFTGCLGKCPTGKICVLPIENNKDEDFIDQESGLSGKSWNKFIRDLQD